MTKKDIRETVKESYAAVAKRGSSCCGPSTSCCGPASADDISKVLGYDEEQLKDIPEGANLGLGCGNPVALASLKEGEVVLDLGSGAGIDVFIAAKEVGEAGKVIGVDMTPEMVERAKANALQGEYDNVEFRLGHIEDLPVDDNSIDAIISNCVINLSPDKKKVFSEAFRVLKPGGRIMVSDIVLFKELPEAIRESEDLYVGCVSGALLKEDYLDAIREAGFKDIEIVHETTFSPDLFTGDPVTQKAIEAKGLSEGDLRDALSTVASIKVNAFKPGGSKVCC